MATHAAAGTSAAAASARAGSEAQGAYGRRRSTTHWWRTGVGGVILGLVAGAAVLLLGWPVDVLGEEGAETDDATASRVLSSPYYDEVIEEYGHPRTWWLADGTNTPGAQPVRAEQWYYPEQGLWITFVDGWRGPEEYFTPEEAIFDSSSDISPTELDRSMTLDEIDRVVGAERQRLGAVATGIGELDTWAYPDAGLVVQLHDGRFFSAQTI